VGEPGLTIVEEGEALIKSWVAATAELRHKEELVSESRQQKRAVEEKLVRWLKPKDAKPGEVICVCYGSQYLQLTVGGFIDGGTDRDAVRCMTGDRLEFRPRGK